MTSQNEENDWGENPGKPENSRRYERSHIKWYNGLAYAIMLVMFLGGAIIGFVLGRITQ